LGCGVLGAEGRWGETHVSPLLFSDSRGAGTVKIQRYSGVENAKKRLFRPTATLSEPLSDVL